MLWLEHSVGEPKNPSSHCLPARLQRKRDLSEKLAAAPAAANPLSSLTLASFGKEVLPNSLSRPLRAES